jgi:hypothetical protein
MRSGRQAIEEKEEKKKKKRNHKQAGTTCRSLLHFSAHKIYRKGKKKVQEPVGERVTKTQRKEKPEKQTQIQSRRKRFETDEHGSTITLSTSLQLLRFCS